MGWDIVEDGTVSRDGGKEDYNSIVSNTRLRGLLVLLLVCSCTYRIIIETRRISDICSSKPN